MQRGTFFTVDMALTLPCFKHSEVICGNKGGKRKIKWVHIMENENVESRLNGGEMILTTGLNWAKQSNLPVNMVTQLINKGAAALCIELHVNISEVPQEIIDIAEKHDFPIIVFHEKVKFIDITKSIYDQIYSNHSTFSSLNLNRLWNMKREADDIEENILKDEFASGVSILLLSRDTTGLLNRLEKAIPNPDIINTYLTSISATLILATSSCHKFELKTRIIDFLNEESKTKNGIKTILISSFFNTAADSLKSIDNLKYLYEISQSFSFKEIISYEDIHLEKIIYPLMKEKTLRDLIAEYLDPLISYDIENNTDLVHTLKVYLRCNGNKKETADQLFIARQTLYHRLNRINSVLGDLLADPNKKMIYEILLYCFEKLNDKHDGKRTLFFPN